MLVVHPSSTCDVCLEGYTGNAKLTPHAIACGHVFCLDCLHHLRQLKCPLCRSPFEDSSIRRIHVDSSDQGASTSARVAVNPSSPILQSPESPSTLRRSPTAKEESVVLYRRHLESKILTIVRASGGSFSSNMYDLVEEIRAFLGQNPQEEVCNVKIFDVPLVVTSIPTCRVLDSRRRFYSYTASVTCKRNSMSPKRLPSNSAPRF
ncbi:hypothetical protein SCHPADRAFT_836520 [Schizopora paradoxa]|uniref:RING-type domain-containing protein n=1 Tax=Schizopora paradoxa TaxID=27342 RepID=A0A0H2RRW7_9AGAM|nr:hypothetical protein SCHPADRAFT_836520 [Schizopora paradoxa]